MKKRMLSLLCVLALCLGLLPVTALAAAPIGQVLYVGGVQISSTGYWTTDSDGNVTASTAGETPTDNYIHYDAENNVLTLHNATIKNELEFNESIEGGTFISGSAIGVFNKSGNAELTISLVGTNTIANVGKGIFVLASSASTGSSNLTIQGDGSLNASASQTGIWVQSNGNNAALCVENAEVTASVDGAVKNGVLVQAKDGSDVSLTVNGGSLTASVNANIWFQFGSGTSGSGTPTVTVSNNAIVRANGGIANNSSSPIQYETGSDSTGGIVFDGNTGTVYGDVTLQEDLEIGEGESLTIPEGSTLDSNSNLTNNGTITIENGGTLNNSESIDNTGTINVENGGKLDGTPTGGTVVYAPTITTENPLPEGTVGTEYNQSLAAENNPTSWSVTIGTLPAGLTLNSDGTITGTPTAEGSSTFTVTAENSAGSDSKEYTLNIKAVSVTGVTLDTDKLELFTGESETLTAKVLPETATDKSVTWESSNPDVATVEDGKVTAVKAGEATITVKTVDGGYTATCTVTVTDKTYTITVDPAKLDFDAAYLGYKTQPAPQTVTITNTGNQQVTVTLPTAKDFVITAGDGFANGRATIEPGNTATFTVQPKADLAVGSYKESINISGSNGNHTVSTSVVATFAVVDSNDTSVDNKLTVTSGISDNITYYTCPSCGYHNWTATEAGYRCDNCGYLESTRQLSGYGNVKGSYTPGSSAAAPAASTIPQTGDESNPVLWTVLLLVSGLALGGLALRRKTEHSRS